MTDRARFARRSVRVVREQRAELHRRRHRCSRTGRAVPRCRAVVAKWRYRPRSDFQGRQQVDER